MENFRFQFQNGYWAWDIDSLTFVRHEALDRDYRLSKKASSVATLPSKQQMSRIMPKSIIKFRDEVTLLDKIRFRKLYQRKIDQDEPEIIVLQDVKDVAFFTANVNDLSSELIEFMHTTVVDRMIRALIVYFQYYLQVWEKLMIRREERKFRIYQPAVTEIENLIKDNLSDLRSMVSIEFGAIVMGAGDVQQFHHLANKNGASLSGRDRRIYNLNFRMLLRIVWLALERPNIGLLEMEMTRLACGDSFHTFIHQGKKVEKLQTTLAEDAILQGVANIKEPRLLQRSPYGKEILIQDHDHRMLAMHLVTFPPTDQRIEFLEICYTAPEELLSEMGVTVGILGKKRSEYDEMLKKREPPKRRRDDSLSYSFVSTEATEAEEDLEFQFTFIIPNKVQHSDDETPNAYPETPPKYSRSKQMTKMIRGQCQMWKDVVKNAGLKAESVTLSLYST